MGKTARARRARPAGSRGKRRTKTTFVVAAAHNLSIRREGENTVRARRYVPNTTACITPPFGKARLLRNKIRGHYQTTRFRKKLSKRYFQHLPPLSALVGTGNLLAVEASNFENRLRGGVIDAIAYLYDTVVARAKVRTTENPVRSWWNTVVPTGSNLW